MAQIGNVLRPQNETPPRNEVADLERRIEALRAISYNKTRLIFSASRHNNQDHVRKILAERYDIEARIESYQSDIDNILRHRQMLAAANEETYRKPESIFAKIRRMAGNILGWDRDASPKEGPDTLSLLSRENIAQSTNVLKDARKGKSFPYFGPVRFRNEQDVSAEKEDFYCICQYTNVLERRNAKGFPMIAIIFRDAVTGEILGRNVGYLDEERFRSTGEFRVESATSNRTPVCNGKKIVVNRFSPRKAA